MIFLRCISGKKSSATAKQRLINVLTADRSALTPDAVMRMQNYIRNMLCTEMMVSDNDISIIAESRRQDKTTVFEITAACTVRQSA